MAAPDCIFCKILAGELPATIVGEDERTIAFMDIAPATRGHALVIPRTHAADLLSVSPDDLQAVALAAQRLAGLADGIPLPSPCHPKLRRRSAATAVDAHARRSARDSGRRAGDSGAIEK